MIAMSFAEKMIKIRENEGYPNPGPRRSAKGSGPEGFDDVLDEEEVAPGTV